MWFKKIIFEFDDILSFMLGILTGFGINILTNKLDFGICWGIISTIIGVTVFIGLKILLGKMDKFEYLMTYGKWERKVFGGVVTWICYDSDEYQLVIGNDVQGNFKENWTKNFRDNENNYSCELFLKRNGIIVNEFVWGYFDGGRIFLPLPDRIYDKNDSQKDFYYYVKNSLKYKMIYKIGDFGSETSFERLFERAEINIISESEENKFKSK